MSVKLPIILITNGRGLSGKDSFAQILSKSVKVYKLSSIDFVKQMTSEFVSVEETGKTPEYRKLLARIKQAFIEFDKYYVTDLIMKQIVALINDKNMYDYIIVDIREPEEIEKLKNAIQKTLKNLMVKVLLFVREGSPQIISNPADEGVYDYAPYDLVIGNNGSLEDFEDSINFILCKGLLSS